MEALCTIKFCLRRSTVFSPTRPLWADLVYKSECLFIFVYVPFPCNLFPCLSSVNLNGRINQAAANWQDQPTTYKRVHYTV